MKVSRVVTPAVLPPVLRTLSFLLAAALCCTAADTPAKKKGPEPSPLDRYAAEAARQAAEAKPTAGSIWTPGAQFADLGRDLKASQVNDIVTIVVNESASAVSTGTTATQRKSSLNSSVTGLAGVPKSTSTLANLANMSTNAQLNGTGTTSRQTTLTTTLSARVTRVLPNGYLMVEGTRDITVNSEHQVVTVRGVVRPADLASDNSVPSTRLAQMEIKLNGKGVVGDAIRRPFILYRILLGLLPF
ncbi:Flagellar L-ring protein [Candidatus Sulfopaludibacter sp. SbA3]|nr:Flagellar L-ring protein [Candidatus Sulfopaludibacter sp. SbA3]